MAITSALKIKVFSFTHKRFYFKVSHKNSSPAFLIPNNAIVIMQML